MNVQLAREIYGVNPWALEGTTFVGLTSLLSDLRNGVSQQVEVKSNHIDFYNLKNALTIVEDGWDLRNAESDAEVVYVIHLNGVITKSGGMSTYGMTDLIAQMKRFDADARVKGGVMMIDSGGGSGFGMELMQHALTEIIKKPVVALIERAGMAASAAYGIASHTSYVYSESKTSRVGSIGTMISFSGHKTGEKDGDNANVTRLYATKSFNKNKDIEEALNNKNYELLINDYLNPFNERFLAAVKTQRPGVLESQLDGSMYDAGDVIGTLVDAIGTFDDAVNKVLELSSAGKTTSKLNNNNKNTTTAMTAKDFQAQHPAAYQEVFGAGVAAEKDRTGAWMAHANTDLAAVKSGIESGKEISATQREEFFVKASSNQKLEDLKADSPKDVIVNESTTKEKTTEETEAETFYKNL